MQVIISMNNSGSIEYIMIMRKILVWCCLLFIACQLKAQPCYDEYFTSRTLRVDLYMTGDAKNLTISMDQLFQEGFWSGNPDKLIDHLNNGNFYVKVYSLIDNNLIYSKGFDCIFGEYQTTRPALNGIKRTFAETVRMPYPENPVNLVIEKRDSLNILQPVCNYFIHPASNQIISEETDNRDRTYNTLINGDPGKKVDLAFVAEGYNSEEWEKFTQDVDHFSKVLFRVEPFKSHQDLFNIYGLFRPSAQRGVDHPTRRIYKNTAIDASFNALNVPRYLLVRDRKTLHDIASAAPYDAIIVIANSQRYGGGGIYNNYTIFTADHEKSEALFMHEFGHGFGGLADEYFSSTVSYENFYPSGVEPTEPNITALLDTNHIKWEDYLTPGIEVPTPWGQDQIAALKKQQQVYDQKMEQEIEKMERKGVSDQAIKKIREKFTGKNAEIARQIDRIQEKYQKKYAGKIGVFEGAGYRAKGLYRSEIGINMFDYDKFTYGKVSEAAILKVIQSYTE